MDISPDDVRSLPGPELPAELDEQLTKLIEVAVAMVRQARASIDDDMAEGKISAVLVSWVVCDMVRTAMLPGENLGRRSFSAAEGPWSESGTFVSAEVAIGRLELNEYHLRMIGLRTRSLGRFPRPDRFYASH